MRGTYLSVVMGMLTLRAVASGATVSQTYDVPQQVLFNNTGTSSKDVSFVTTFNQFNPSLGTLNSATITYYYDFDLSIAGNSGTPSGSGGATSSASDDGMHINGALVSGDGGGNGNGDGTVGDVVDAPFTVTDTTSGDPPLVITSAYTNGAFQALSGNGTANWDWTTVVDVNSGNANSTETLTLLNTPQDESRVNIVYDYTPAPEPITIMMMLPAIAVAGMRRRKR